MMRRLSSRVSKRFAEFDRGDPTKAFELVDCLGEGTYGSVWSAVELKSKRKTAVKIVPIDNDLDEIKAEIAIMRDSQSDFIIKLFSAYVSSDKNHIWMSMEVCEAGSVNDLMFVTDQTLTLEQLQDVTASAAMGLQYLHKRFIIHRDIKCGNILLNARGQCKLADFGVSAVLKSKDDRTTTAIGAPFWMAPECISELPYDGRADVWSLGITVIEMAESRPPNSHIHPMRALFIIPHQPPPTLTNPAEWPADMVDFVTKCLTKKMEERITSVDCINHPFIQKSCKALSKSKGCSRVLEKLVKDSMPLIEEFRSMDESDSDSDYEDSTLESEQPNGDTMLHKAATTQETSTRPRPPPKSRGSVQTFYMYENDEEEDSSRNSTAEPFDKFFAEEAAERRNSSSSARPTSRQPSSRFNPPSRHQERMSTSSFVEVSDRSRERRRTAGPQSQRSIAPIRPKSLKKSTIQKKAQTLTQSTRSSTPKALSKRFSKSRLSSRKHSSNFGEGFLPKSEQNRMSMQDLQNMVSKRQQSVRNSKGVAPVDDFSSMVMTKQFIHLLKQSKQQAPDLFKSLTEVSEGDPSQVLAATIQVLQVAAGSAKLKGGGSSTSKGKGKARPAPRPVPPPPPT